VFQNVASVTECVVNSGQVQAFMSVNKDYGNYPVQPNVSIGVDGYDDDDDDDDDGDAPID
jgi:hypothetical protein